MEKKPSNYKGQPWNSALQKSEAETIARNIMVILSRTGDVWREMSPEEYETERIKDGGYSKMELNYFEKVWPYCKSADTADLFSKDWYKS